MLFYLQILIFLTLLAWLAVYWSHFFWFNHKRVEAPGFDFIYFIGSLKFVMNFFLFFLYSCFLLFYYLEKKTVQPWLLDSREIFLSLAWLSLLVFVWVEKKARLSLGFFLTPIIMFMALLGLTVGYAPELYFFSHFENYEELQVWRNSATLVGLLGELFYIYVVVFATVHYRLYLELKYHLIRRLTLKLPSINVVDQTINRYLLWGSVVSLISLLLFMKVPASEDVFFLQKVTVKAIVFMVFAFSWWVRRKKYLSIKLNLVLLICGGFFHLFYLLYL